MPCVSINKLPLPPPGLTGWPWTEGSGISMGTGLSYPTISIVTPSYNQGRFLEQTIRSVLLQGYPCLEYFVIDGGSTDSSIEIIRKYESFLDGWTGERDGGQSDAINRGLSRSKGMLANWLCSDDFLLPGALWELAGTFMKEPESILYVGAGCNVDEQGRVLYERWNTESQVNEPLDWIQNWFFQPSAFFRHEFWQEHPLDVELHFAMDLDFYIRASHHGSICLVPQLISCAREHPQSKSIVRRAEFFGEIARVQARYGGADIIGRDVTRLQKAVREILGSWPCRFLREFLPSVDWHGLK